MPQLGPDDPEYDDHKRIPDNVIAKALHHNMVHMALNQIASCSDIDLFNTRVYNELGIDEERDPGT